MAGEPIASDCNHRHEDKGLFVSSRDFAPQRKQPKAHADQAVSCQAALRAGFISIDCERQLVVFHQSRIEDCAQSVRLSR